MSDYDDQEGAKYAAQTAARERKHNRHSQEESLLLLFMTAQHRFAEQIQQIARLAAQGRLTAPMFDQSASSLLDRFYAQVVGIGRQLAQMQSRTDQASRGADRSPPDQRVDREVPTARASVYLQQQDTSIAGAFVAQDKNFLDEFARDLADGKYFFDALTNPHAIVRAERRAASYSAKLRAAATESWARSLPEGSRLFWCMSAEEHCPDCPVIAKGGPYTVETIPTYPGACETACMTNCGCYLVTSDGLEAFRVRLDNDRPEEN